jgi:membrane-associated protease RseP (regulator of RpoE activity)
MTPPRRWWLHLSLFLVTALTTTIVGAKMALNFAADRPAFVIEEDVWFFVDVWQTPSVLWAGLPFSLTLLAILLAHEMGHYVACWFYRIDASLPYFLPAPTLIGTFGAFIRIRAPIYSRRQLFDIGVAGPLAGFAVIVPALGAGLAYSKILPGIAGQGDVLFGTPVLLWAAARAVFGDAAVADIYLHPVARAAWVGLLATALNLLPIGQLDGGHILYSLWAARHKLLSRVFALVLAVVGLAFGWFGWIAWAGFFFFAGLRHPPIVDETPVGAARMRLAWLAAVILVLSFTPVPILLRGSEIL